MICDNLSNSGVLVNIITYVFTFFCAIHRKIIQGFFQFYVVIRVFFQNRKNRFHIIVFMCVTCHVLDYAYEIIYVPYIFLHFVIYVYIFFWVNFYIINHAIASFIYFQYNICFIFKYISYNILSIVVVRNYINNKFFCLLFYFYDNGEFFSKIFYSYLSLRFFCLVTYAQISNGATYKAQYTSRKRFMPRHPRPEIAEPCFDRQRQVEGELKQAEQKQAERGPESPIFTKCQRQVRHTRHAACGTAFRQVPMVAA